MGAQWLGEATDKWAHNLSNFQRFSKLIPNPDIKIRNGTLPGLQKL
jgi:hypothetical protein